MNAGLSSVEYCFAISIASLIDTFGGTSSIKNISLIAKISNNRSNNATLSNSQLFNLSIIFKGVHGNAGKPENWILPPSE